MGSPDQVARHVAEKLRGCSEYFPFPFERRLFTVVGVDLLNRTLAELHPWEFDLQRKPEDPIKGLDLAPPGELLYFGYSCSEGARLKLSTELFVRRDDALEQADLLTQSMQTDSEAIERRMRWVAVSLTWDDDGKAWVTAAHPLEALDDLDEITQLFRGLETADEEIRIEPVGNP